MQVGERKRRDWEEWKTKWGAIIGRVIKHPIGGQFIFTVDQA